jgi:hypothetical protein
MRTIAVLSYRAASRTTPQRFGTFSGAQLRTGNAALSVLALEVEWFA